MKISRVIKQNYWIQLVNHRLNIHIPHPQEDIFVFSTARSGSTWLMELLASQPGFKHCNEPFNLRDPWVAGKIGKLGIRDWNDLYDESKLDQIKDYLSRFQTGRYLFKNPPFYRNHYRIITSRILFKIIHALEDRVNWLMDNFNANVILQFRHPIPASLSRHTFPKIDVYINGIPQRFFTAEQLKEAKQISDKGSKLEKGVLNWSMQNYILHSQTRSSVMRVTYEQMVIDPDPIIQKIVADLILPDPKRMLDQLLKPSGSSGMSDQKTIQFLENRTNASKNRWLIEKWKSKVTDTEEKKLMDIVGLFNIDIYQYGKYMPTEPYLIK
jgi:hypothetical protein